MNSDKFEKLSLRLVSAYVKTYDEHSFEICLDGKECLKIGDSTNIVNVRITDSGKVLESIFVEGSLGLGESYCEGLIDVDDLLNRLVLTYDVAMKRLFKIFRLSPGPGRI